MSQTPTTPPAVPETVRRYFELVDAGETEALVQLFAPDATYERPGYPPITGHEGLRAFYGGERVIESGRHTLTHAVVAGDEVAVQGTFRGVRRDGAPLDLRFSDFYTLDGDRIVRRTTYFYAPLA
ncbi:nuclear transport factor 2 family protein [Arsenicicoccus dermatophilus]|uniref:nuclear transport factor 2 family protein n=1 Tax=Arsenicicoccus dermatophilus TaxID=1076331 RepID=UPI001F4CC87D|nr:nuclear transport factor 2 family protein [Arsenicicoccus dermatophilus]MCH8614231.1 nuclear transport factor 2 family protein [Arsenicicoccus dermatophilus]